MTAAALWVLGLTVAAGLGLSCFYLLERPIVGRARLASYAHGLAGATGVGLLLAAVWGAADAQGFGRIAAYSLGATLLAGLIVFAAQLRRRRPSGLVVALHATLGVAGFVIFVAYASLPR